MKRFSLCILKRALPALALIMAFSAGKAIADSIVRIIGDDAAKSSDNSGALPSIEPLNISEGHIRIFSDKAETVQNKVPVHPVVNGVVEQERPSEMDAERQLSQSLANLKAEKERNLSEKAELERQAESRARLEHEAEEAARQEAIKKELDQLASSKAEGVLRAAEKVEQERIAAARAEEERLAPVHRAPIEKSHPEVVPQPEKSAAAITAAGFLKATDGGADSRANQVDVSSNITGVSPETIWDLYALAKASDPVLARAEARVTGSKADSDVLFSALMPHLDSSAGVKRVSQALSNYSPDDTTDDYSALNYNITARMTLLHVPTIYSLDASAAALRAESAGVSAARQSLIVKFMDSYFALLKAQVDKQIAVGEINRLKQVLNQSRAFLEAGTGDVIAVYEAQSRLDSAAADLTRSESNLKLAEQKLSTVVGKPVALIVNYLPTRPSGPDPEDLDWWIATMEKEQPVVRQAHESLALYSEQKKAVKAEYLPILQASGGYDVNRGTAALPSAEVRQWFVGASISLPLYSGGETAAKVRRALASEEERRHIFKETMDQQRESLKQAFYNLRYNINYIAALEQRKTSAEIQLAAVGKGRKIGTRTAIDLLNAEQAYSVALRDHKYALYDNIIRVVQLKSAAGILTEADISKFSTLMIPVKDNVL